jgi:S-adenosyl-L-methionine hydrolase (adenosine-forming)
MLTLVVKRRRVPLLQCYVAIQPGRLVAVPGSTGFLEIAVSQGIAEQSLCIKVGDPVLLRLPCP